MSLLRPIASGILLIGLVLGWTSPVEADGPGPSLVTVSGHRLLVQKRQPDGSLAPAEPYVIRGVDWSPASRSTPGDDTVRRAEFINWVATDAPLLESLNINTVRLYLDPGLDAGGLAVLDTLWAHGIMVVLNVDGSRNDLTRVQQVVSFYKDHPAVLLWMLGSEWNINLYYGKGECNTPLKAAQCTQTAAQLVKSLDTNHPVASSYGEIHINSVGLQLADTQNYVNNICTAVDVWALNVFRGDTFGTLFDQWRSISRKPMFLGEFGTDAMIHPADLPDETMQAGWDLCLWNHAITELSAVQPSLVSLGGLVFEWNDEWWKVPPAGTQNVGGFGNTNGHPDGFANEDWFGIVDIDRNLRHAATALGEGFESTYRPPPRGLVFGVGSRGSNANQYAGQYGYSRFYRCGRKFYDKSGGGFGGRGFNAVVLDPVTGAQIQAPQNFDTWGTRLACAQNNPSAAMYGLVSYLDSAPAGSLILLSVADEAGLNQNESCAPYSTSSCFAAGLSALEALGSTKIRSYCFWNSWAMIAIKGQGAMAEGLSTNKLVSLQTTLPDPGSFSLSLQKAGTGSGLVTSDPVGISCGDSCGSAAATFPSGTLVAFNPVATGVSIFTGWSGDSDCANGVVTIDADKTCIARFELLKELAVAKAGSGTGTVTSTPAGIDCGSDCAESYAFNTSVTLVAAQSFTSRFVGWTGACTGTGSCVVTMDAAKSVIATFNQLMLLTVGRIGSGSGQVTSSPVGISCGTDCGENYDLGTQVTLTATPAAGSRFISWSICDDTAPCTFTMDTGRHVTANFQQLFTLVITKSGSGAGNVASSPVGIDCGADCSDAYGSGTIVTLTATPAAGSRFSGWSGACIGTGSCVVTMNAAKSVTATFVPTSTLTVGKSGSGSGTVTSSPAGINCGADCSEPYDTGTLVTLTASPAVGSRFSGWSGACTGTGSCAVTMDAEKSVTATFSQIYSLTASKSGSGSGTVTSSPAGIDCGADCSESYDVGTAVTLTATPAAGSRFSSWSGACTGNGSCVVTMTASRSVTATFVQTYALTIGKSGSGSGTVSSSPAGINCGADCSEVHDAGTVVTLTATPVTGSGFSGWSGACTGTGSCAVTMDAAKSVTAVFDVLSFSLTVSMAGTGAGTVTSSPAGIDCGSDCSEGFVFGTTVILTPEAGAGSQFAGWEGACSGTGVCAVTMEDSRSVTAAFTAGSVNLDFYTIEPCRILDTRDGTGAIASGETRVFPVTGLCGIPSDARAVALNVAAASPTGPGNLALFPSDVPAPLTSTVNFGTGVTRSNNAILLLSSDTGSLAARSLVVGDGEVHLVVDASGYFR